MNEREPGKFPTDTRNPCNDHVKAITLRRGTEIQGATALPPTKVHAEIESSFPLTNEFAVVNDMSSKERELLMKKKEEIETEGAQSVLLKGHGRSSHSVEKGAGAKEARPVLTNRQDRSSHTAEGEEGMKEARPVLPNGQDRSSHADKEKTKVVQSYPPPPYPQRLRRQKEEKSLKTFVDHL